MTAFKTQMLKKYSSRSLTAWSKTYTKIQLFFDKLCGVSSVGSASTAFKSHYGCLYKNK